MAEFPTPVCSSVDTRKGPSFETSAGKQCKNKTLQSCSSKQIKSQKSYVQDKEHQLHPSKQAPAQPGMDALYLPLPPVPAEGLQSALASDSPFPPTQGLRVHPLFFQAGEARWRPAAARHHITAWHGVLVPEVPLLIPPKPVSSEPSEHNMTKPDCTLLRVDNAVLLQNTQKNLFQGFPFQGF